MANGKGSALGIIAIIIGVSGLGMGTFTIIKYEIVEGTPGLDGVDGIDGVNGTDGIDGINGTLDNLVAVWETLTGFGAPASSFYIAFDDISFNRSEFFTVMLSNTIVSLIKPGWYRISIRFIMHYLDANGPNYQVDLEKNDVPIERLDRVGNTPDTYYSVNTFAYVLSDGDDVFRFRCFASDTSTFNIYAAFMDQLVIEYVEEL